MSLHNIVTMVEVPHQNRMGPRVQTQIMGKYNLDVWDDLNFVQMSRSDLALALYKCLLLRCGIYASRSCCCTPRAARIRLRARHFFNWPPVKLHYGTNLSCVHVKIITADANLAYRESAAGSTSKASKEKKFPCYRVTSGETTCDKSFARKADLQRHQSCVHDKDQMERLDCTFRKCTRKGVNGFLRKDHLTEHLRHFHNQKLPKRHRRGVSDVAMQGDEQDEDLMQDYGYSQQ